jgi:hypothetical protein
MKKIMSCLTNLYDRCGGKHLGRLLALLLALAISTGVVSAQSIVGSWEELVRFPAGVPISQQVAVVIFHDDGTTLASGQGFVIGNSMKNAQVESDGFGAWVQLDSSRFEYTNEAVLSDLKGNLTGFFKVRGVYKLDSSGDSYAGNSYYQFLGPHHEEAGGPQGWVCNNGVRIRAESPPTGSIPECVQPQP